MSDLERAVANASTLWTLLAESREQQYVRGPEFLVVEGGVRSRRVMVLSPAPSPAAVEQLVGWATKPSAGGVTFEDSFSTVDLTEHGLARSQLAVMVREPAPLPALPTPIVKISVVDQGSELPTVEWICVEAFPMETFQPYEPGRAFPPALFERDEVTFFLARRDDVPVGMTVTVVAGGVVGVYWVTTVPEHRSLGIGRALMHAVLEHHADLPATLTSATAARPLYESLAFRTLGLASWWSAPPS